MKCKICQSESPLVKTLRVRNKYDAEYYLCPTCGFMFVGNATWLAEAYQHPINISDTGYVLRNVYLARKTLVLFTFLFGSDKKYLDFAGGYGILARLLRDYGLDFYNDDVYVENLFMKGFEYSDQTITAQTCFECFEHLDTPLKDIERMFSISKNIFFSTVLLTAEVPPADNWEYYGLNHGQHVAFWSEKSLGFIAKKYNLHFTSDGKTLHLLSQEKVSRSYFKFLLFLTKLQFDLVVRKLLKSKTISDSEMIKKAGRM